MIQFLRSFLSLSVFYSFFGWLIGGSSCRTEFVHKYVSPKPGDKILDIGCGPGDIVPYLPDVEYIGFDASLKYIKTAQAKYGHLGQFYCQKVSRTNFNNDSDFDIVLAVGIVHHLNDLEALELLALAKDVLKPGGKLVTFDGVFLKNQSPIARYIIAQDRGKFVRHKEEYFSLTSKVFSDIKVSIRHDLLRIPYTHLILECTK
ncbi:MAG: class I SAM-dependent methyltransferase [Symploca sp. SIO1B1]|nr:class I SAM-dependent methyltransferase [Symploca sp. SIO1B1]